MAAGQQTHADPRDLLRTMAADRDALGGGRSASGGRSTTSEADAHFVVRREEEKKNKTWDNISCSLLDKTGQEVKITALLRQPRLGNTKHGPAVFMKLCGLNKKTKHIFLLNTARFHIFTQQQMGLGTTHKERKLAPD